MCESLSLSPLSSSLLTLLILLGQSPTVSNGGAGSDGFCSLYVTDNPEFHTPVLVGGLGGASVTDHPPSIRFLGAVKKADNMAAWTARRIRVP